VGFLNVVRKIYNIPHCRWLMDTFAHGIWSFIIFSHFTNPWLAVFFGMMPDLFSWTIYMFYRLFSGAKFGKPDLSTIPHWAFTLYGMTHSVFVMGAVFLIVYLFTGGLPLYLLAWTLHVLIDIPTHSRDFLPTPFLWPLSDWHFPGFSWGQRWFMIANYSAITAAIFFFH